MAKSFANPSLDGLVDLACRDGVDIRPTLLRVLTDLYVQKPSHGTDEEVQYVELAQRLIEAVDAPTRAIVAATLGKYAAAPPAILKCLAAIEAPTSPNPLAPDTAKPAPRPDLMELFFDAGPEERWLILVNLDAVAATSGRRTPPAAIDAARRLEQAALQHHAGEFIRILERSLGIGRSLAERIARDSAGEPVVVAAKALGMKADRLQRILLFHNPAVGQSIRRVYELSRLFDEMTAAAAVHMLAIWRQAAPRSQPVHEPVLADDERLRARALATSRRHRAARTKDGLPARSKTAG
jgi:hypothetical protein